VISDLPEKVETSMNYIDSYSRTSAELSLLPGPILFFQTKDYIFSISKHDVTLIVKLEFAALRRPALILEAIPAADPQYAQPDMANIAS